MMKIFIINEVTIFNVNKVIILAFLSKYEEFIYIFLELDYKCN